ncbi:MAG TPA: hypothetical protein VHY76_10265 [Acetobacteraceae bacterium]|nr:hypothetical protein [Acetobacteraceae bacterium]
MTASITPALMGPLSALLGTLIGGGISFVAAMYTQRCQDRLQRVANEITKRETVYTDFVMTASNLLLNAYTRDAITVGADEQRIAGLISRMRLFAPPKVVAGAERVMRTIVEIELQPSVDLRELAKKALSQSPEPEPLLAFSSLCRTDLDHVRRRTA